MRRYIMTLTGPSCSGKTTLLRSLLATGAFVPLISDTTRDMRPGEVAGEEYNFVSPEEWFRVNQEGGYAQTVHFNGNFYGTRYQTVLDAFAKNKCPVRIVEPSGVNQFRRIATELNAEVIAVFVDQDPEVLVRRWLERVQADSAESLDYYTARILHTIHAELGWVNEAEYDFYYDLRYRSPLELNHALVAVSRGALTPGQVRQIAPRIKDAA